MSYLIMMMSYLFKWDFYLYLPFFSIVPKHIKYPFLTKQIILDIQKGEKASEANAKSYWFFGQNMITRSKRSEKKNCLSSSNVNLCLLDSVESIVQGIKFYRKQQVVLK